MKCPKCGKPVKHVALCAECHKEVVYRHEHPEPTTAEMALWLFEHKVFNTGLLNDGSYYIRLAVTGKVHHGAPAEAIRTAYAEAQKQEVTE